MINNKTYAQNITKKLNERLSHKFPLTNKTANITSKIRELLIEYYITLAKYISDITLRIAIDMSIAIATK